MNTRTVNPRALHDPDGLVEDLEFLADVHVGATEAARRTSFTTPAAMEKWLKGRGHRTLWLRLSACDPLTCGNHTQRRRHRSGVAA